MSDHYTYTRDSDKTKVRIVPYGRGGLNGDTPIYVIEPVPSEPSAVRLKEDAWDAIESYRRARLKNGDMFAATAPLHAALDALVSAGRREEQAWMRPLLRHALHMMAGVAVAHARECRCADCELVRRAIAGGE